MGSAYGISNCLAWYSTQFDFDTADVTLGKCSVVFSDAGTTPAGNGAAVQQWNDGSGSGNHATQSTAANRPIFRSFAGWHPGGNQPCVSFDQLGSNSQSLVVPSGVAIGNGSPASEGTILLALRGQPGDGFPIGLGNCGLWQVANFPTWFNGSEHAFPTANLLPIYHPHVCAVRFKTGESRYYYGSIYHDLIGSNLVSGTLAGGFLGSLNGSGFFANVDLYEVLVFNQALSDSNMSYLLRLLQDRLCPEWSNSANAVFFGDSRTMGYNSNLGSSFPYFRAWPYRALRTIGGYAKATTLAHPGDKIADQKTKMLADASINSAVWDKNVWVGEVGINDILAGTSAATIYAALVDLWNTILANGASNVVALTIAPAASLSAGQETIRQAVNASIRSTSISGVTLVDNGGDTRFALAGYCDSDGLHFTDAGYGVYSQNVAPALQQVLGIWPPSNEVLAPTSYGFNGGQTGTFISGAKSLTNGTFDAAGSVSLTYGSFK